MVAPGGNRAPQIGAVTLGVALVVPPIAGTAAHFLLHRRDAPDGDWLAYNLLLLNAVAAAAATAGALLLARYAALREAGAAGPSLIAFAGFRFVAAVASIVLVVHAPAAQTWQVAIALALPDIFFALSLCGALALVFEPADALLAKHTRQFGVFYAIYRGALLAIWAVPEQLRSVVTESHRATAPIMAGVLLILLLRAARILKGH